MTARGIPPGLTDPRFAGDDGSADPVLTAALEAAARDPARLPEVLAALHRARVLAPVLARPGEADQTAGGLVRDKSAEVVVPLLVDDGGRALPVFTCLAALARWDPAARPVPVTGPRAALVALAEDAGALVVDIAGPTPVDLPGPELRALADGRGRRPAWDDPELAGAVAAVLDRMAAARSAHLEPWAGRDARLTVVISADADRSETAGLLADALAALPEVRAGVRGLEVTVVTVVTD